MNSKILHIFFFTIQLFLVFSQSTNVILSNMDGEFYPTCNNKFSCGDTITEIGFPFRGINEPPKCGHPNLVLTCDPQRNITTINIINMRYQVSEIFQTNKTMRLVREDVIDQTCPANMVNTTLDYSVLEYTEACTNLTFLYGCSPSLNPRGSSRATCQDVMDNNVYVLPGNRGPGPECNVSVIVPVVLSHDFGNNELGGGGSADSRESEQLLLLRGFDVQWKLDSQICSDCIDSRGSCGYNYEINQTTCICTDPPHYFNRTCPESMASSPRGNDSKSTELSIGLGIAGAVLAGVGLGWLIFFCKQRRKNRLVSAQFLTKELTPLPSSKELLTHSTAFTKSIPSYPSSPSEYGRDSSYFGVHVFNYTELEQATENFNASRELGEGGFGTVYYGVLSDGRIVAVKRLYENNFKRVEQFMNEVEILTRLRHQYLVVLYGCTSKRSRELLLVYEYVPNGTVADHLHGKRAKSGLLSWPIRLNVAIETAEALTYLHKSDIIHRDVKTTNILLDNDFHVKVADFGLSRLFPTDVTHVSTCPQGTPGYVDPEYYQCYQLTEKSDIYSFGVVLIELISSLQAVDTNRHRHDINLSNMAINKIQNHTLHELVDPSLGFETNSSLKRMVTLVAELAFRCLQQESDMRPSMEEVLEALKGIKNEDINADNVEIVDILVDNGLESPLKGSGTPSPNGSTPNSRR